VHPGKIGQSETGQGKVGVSTAMMPALQQVGGIEFLLLTTGLFLQIGAALAGAQGFEDLAFAIGLMVSPERLLPQEFEPANVRLEFLAEVLQVLAQNSGKLEFGASASGGERGGVGPRRVA